MPKRKSDLDISVLVGYLDILYNRVFTFHREPCSANLLLRPKTRDSNGSSEL